ncbi:hypothetical protein [Streptomyces capitiformicae]|uniref:Protein kinase domain-containing protein n=1 Tax=Streptomyces capitiformicae TaxID=2014920 RepID=A0A919GN19_9ACTN|nr:hypothetical protein [Streptomyces capitiformicae]GHH87194.1 hypothetical protein GCM10017771_27290 [Streptomyces capitiformicae]
MSPVDGADVTLHTLALGDRIGDGGQGEVFDVTGPGRLLYKSYREPHKVDGKELAALVALRQGLAPADRDRLDRETAWPLCRVVDGGRVTGFLMHRAPDSMTWRTSRGDTRLNELSYLLRAPKAAWQAVAQPTPAERHALVVAAVELFQWLHALGLVVGDVSQANVLWTVRPGPAVHLLDCDGVRLVGRPPVLEQADTPDWHDPLAVPGTVTVDSDRYKVALLVGRVLSQDAYSAPGRRLEPLPGVLDDRREHAVRALWDQAAEPRGGRPHLGQWRIALAGRETIRLAAAEPAVRPPVDRTKVDGPRRRGRISLRD